MMDGGRLHLTTTTASLAREQIDSQADGQHTDYAVLSVSDTGVGIADDVIDQIFEPFFSTKPAGKGSGLGLAVVDGIVSQLNGFVQAESVLGEATTFSVYLPLSTDSVVEQTTVSENTLFQLRGEETILVVEDDAQVRSIATRILERAGYTLIIANNGVQAMEQYAAHKERIDLVFVDVVMPEMGGKEVMLNVLADNPDMHILFTSGYFSDTANADFIVQRGFKLLQKPYTQNNLLTHVRRALDAT